MDSGGCRWGLKAQWPQGRLQAGPLFLCLPNGEVLKNGQKERWMLE